MKQMIAKSRKEAYEIFDQETGKRIGNLVKTRRAAERMVTMIHKKTRRYPDYRPVEVIPGQKIATIAGQIDVSELRRWG